MKLKNYIIIFAALLALPLISSAQQSYFGLRFGYVQSSLKGEGSSEIMESSLNTFAGALVFSSAFEDLPMGISIEPGYILKGSDVSSDSLDYRFHYFSIPLLLDVYPFDKLKLSLGLEPGYLVSAVNKEAGETPQSIVDNYNRFEVSGILGASYSLAFFADIGFRYNLSFTDVADYDPLLDANNLSNQYWQAFLILKIAN